MEGILNWPLTYRLCDLMKELSSVVATNDIYEKLTVIKQRLLILSNQIIVLNQ